MASKLSCTCATRDKIMGSGLTLKMSNVRPEPMFSLFVQAGASIVADSVPESEWLETQNKARAVLRAAEMVLDGLESWGQVSILFG